MYLVWKTTPVTDVNYERSIKLRFKRYEKLVLKEIETAKRPILVEFLQHTEVT